ncbi:MAG: hypothetical protein F4Y02_09410 [Chloroflexi bacterium]|nr:hypothetical protein [Chloroflexota bacterium]
MAEAISQAGIAQMAWDGRLDAERNYLYYAALSDRYRRQHLWLISAVAVTSFLAGSSFVIDVLPPWTSAVLAMLASLLALALITLDPSMKSAKAESAKQHFRSISDEWKYLWWHQYEGDAEAKARMLDVRTMSGPDVPVAVDDKLNNACHDRAIAIVRAEYSVPAA